MVYTVYLVKHIIHSRKLLSKKVLRKAKNYTELWDIIKKEYPGWEISMQWYNWKFEDY